MLVTKDHVDAAFIRWTGLMINVLVDTVFQAYHVYLSVYRSMFQGFKP